MSIKSILSEKNMKTANQCKMLKVKLKNFVSVHRKVVLLSFPRLRHKLRRESSICYVPGFRNKCGMTGESLGLPRPFGARNDTQNVFLHERLQNFLFFTSYLLLFTLFTGCSSPQTAGSLFDGKTLGNWKVTNFFRHGDVYVKDNCLIMEKSNAYLTGVNWDGPVPRINYEISFEAIRLEGKDFFCGLTFPVDANYASLILSGWSGNVSGISSINGMDASENETTKNIPFRNDRWYKVVLRVIPGRIQAWLDGKQILDVDITGKKISVRSEVEPSKPLGLATYMSSGAVRKIRLKELK
jgi:hypothetical protein